MDTPEIVLMSAYFEEMKVEHIIGEEAIIETLTDRVGILSKDFVYKFLLEHKNLVFIDYLDKNDFLDSNDFILIDGLSCEACLKDMVKHISDNEQWAIVYFCRDFRRTTYKIARINNIKVTGEAVAYYRGIEIDAILKELC